MSLPVYPNNRLSGAPELGPLPAHWNAVRLKRIAHIKGGSGFPHENQGRTDEELSFHKVNALAQADQRGRLLRSENTVSRQTAALLGATVFPPETIVFAKVGAALLLGRIRALAEEACLDNNMMGVVPTSRVSEPDPV